MSQAEALYHLQLLDSQLDAIRKRLTEIGTALDDNAAVQLARSEFEQAEGSHREWQKRQTNLEHERAQLQSDMADTEQRLYSGKITNPRELVNLQDKLKELITRRDALDEPVLETMIALEDGAKIVQTSGAMLQQIITEQAVGHTELERERSDLNRQLDQLSQQAAAARAAILPTHLPRYDTLRMRGGGVAVAVIRDGACSVCGVELTTQLIQQVRHDDIIPCPTCGRILSI